MLSVGLPKRDKMSVELYRWPALVFWGMLVSLAVGE